MGVRSRSTAGGRETGLAVNATTGAAALLTVPDEANVAEIYVEVAPIRFTRDGTAPSTTSGQVANVGDIILLNSRDECDKFRAIEDTTTDATVEVEYFTDVSG